MLRGQHIDFSFRVLPEAQQEYAEISVGATSDRQGSRRLGTGSFAGDEETLIQLFVF